MKAIRVRKKTKDERYAYHWLTDDELTRCGLDVDELHVVDDLELDELPSVEGCRGCARNVDGWKKPKPPPVEPTYYLHASPASKGRLSKTGPLRQSGRSGHGHRLR